MRQATLAAAFARELAEVPARLGLDVSKAECVRVP
jgi:hypothetical protein